MTVVIDVGCARYGGDYSIERLIEMYEPRVLYGYDPGWKNEMYESGDASTTVVVVRAAAWTYDGDIGFFADGLNSQVGSPEWPKVKCVDLAREITEIGEVADGDPIILKLDAEGSEYDLLWHLLRRRADSWLEKAIIEWHCRACGRGGGGHIGYCVGLADDRKRRKVIERRLSCPVEEWQW